MESEGLGPPKDARDFKIPSKGPERLSPAGRRAISGDLSGETTPEKDDEETPPTPVVPTPITTLVPSPEEADIDLEGLEEAPASDDEKTITNPPPAAKEPPIVELPPISPPVEETPEELPPVTPPAEEPPEEVPPTDFFKGLY